jgi:diguanylate cyclase (GGDEF)-like protein
MRVFDALDAVRGMSDSAEPFSSQIGSLLATIYTYNFFGELFLVSTILLVILLLGCIVWLFRLNRILSGRASSYHRELDTKNRQIQMLQQKINSFDDARDAYLNLITNMSFVMRNVNFRHRLEDLAGTLSSLVSNILHADVVEFYAYEPSEDVLKRVVPHTGQTSKEPLVLPIGKGLVGTAAKDRMIITTEYFNRRHLEGEALWKADRRLWMAAPILFENQILGVIAIGEPRHSNGTEKELLGIVAQISGVVLYHQSFLIRARQNADTDVLTGLHNRRYFYRMSRQAVEQATRERAPISILLIDLDHFKHYNDSNGHEQGDRLLIEFGGLLRGCTPEDAVVARYGGEEFIVMLPGVSTEDALRYGEYLRNAIARHPFPHREKQPFGFVSISGGIACFPNHGRSIQEAIRLADGALYRAKESGRNRILTHDPCLGVTDENKAFFLDSVEENMAPAHGRRLSASCDFPETP